MLDLKATEKRFNDIKNQVKLESEVGKYTLIKQANYDSYKVALQCPLCGALEKYFTINQSNTFYCFNCHQGGDVITFIAKKLGLTQNEAVDRLEKQLKGGDMTVENYADMALKIKKQHDQ